MGAACTQSQMVKQGFMFRSDKLFSVAAAWGGRGLGKQPGPDDRGPVGHTKESRLDSGAKCNSSKGQGHARVLFSLIMLTAVWNMDLKRGQL